MFKENHFTLFHVFTGKNALGNPAAVTVVETMPDFIKHKTMHSGCDTTVYIKPRQDNEFDIRWFNNTGAIQRCGHGTLAAAAYLQEGCQENHKNKKELIFYSKTESLLVTIEDNSYLLQLDTQDLKTCRTFDSQKHLPFSYQQLAYTDNQNGYIIVELNDELSVKQFTLNAAIIDAIQQRALIITAKSEHTEFDIIFRYFAPQYGPPEDSATGSAASVLWPFWNRQNLKNIYKDTLHCYQASQNGGIIKITGSQHRICIHGRVIKEP